MSGSHRDLQQAPSAPRPVLVRRLLPTHPHSSFARQGLPGPAPDPAAQNRKSRRAPAGLRSASSLRTPRCLIRPGFLLTSGSVAAGTRSSDDLFYRRLFDLDQGPTVFAVLIAARLA